MHCASLGEFEQGRPVIEKLRTDERFKEFDLRIIVSFFSPSGYNVMRNYQHADSVIYLPMDSASNAIKLIDQLKPSFVLWVKYEYWHFYLSELKSRQIPVLLVSGIFRESQPFFKWYGRFWTKMLMNFEKLFVQNQHSANLVNKLNAGLDVEISGDTRFDRVIAISEERINLEAVERFCEDNWVIVAGSTWEEDETEWMHFAKTNKDVKIIIAPHEIDSENLKDVKQSFPGSIFYSELLMNRDRSTASNVLIIDNIGLLSKLYRYADIAYVGGGFGDDGVHNVLEAAVYGIPVIHGPEYDKYAEAVELVKCEGSIVINSALELERLLAQLFSNPQKLEKHGKAAKSYVMRNGGATNKIVDYIYAKRLLTS
jgi:3-deoxy-D-manno-octulosonic-acid transferase